MKIAGEVDNALRDNRPSLYFSTYILTNNYWPFGGERPEGDTGGTYTFEYASEEEEPTKDEVPVETEPKTFMDILRDMRSADSLDYGKLKKAFIDMVFSELCPDGCGAYENDLFVVDRCKFSQCLEDAYGIVLDRVCNSTDSCCMILQAMRVEKLSSSSIYQCAQDAICNWCAPKDIQTEILARLYRSLGEENC